VNDSSEFVDLCPTFQFLSTPCDKFQHHIDHFPIVLGASSLEPIVKIDWKLDIEAALHWFGLDALLGHRRITFSSFG